MGFAVLDLPISLRGNDMNWTEQQIEQLRGHVTAGLSMSQIGAEMGLSCNSIIGMAHQLGLAVKWTDEHTQTARTMAAAGSASRAIGTALGFSHRTVVKWCKKLGINLWSHGGRTEEQRKPEWYQQVRDLAAEGLSARQIAEVTGTTKGTISGWCRRNNVKLSLKPGGYGQTRDVKRRLFDRRYKGPAVFVPKELPPLSMNVALIDLEQHHCRWPYGTRAPFLFCGHVKQLGESYCPFHTREATPKNVALSLSRYHLDQKRQYAKYYGSHRLHVNDAA